MTGSHGQAGNKPPWSSHITIAYSTARQPAEPVIAALGLLVNQCDPERS